jgi:hypothetical protein
MNASIVTVCVLCKPAGVGTAGLKVNREHQIRQLHDLVLRFRSGMRSYFGADSPQYEQAGGTRASARKPSARTPKAPPPTPGTA